MQDNLYLAEAREKLMNGVKRAAAVVGATMGTSGSNSIIETLENPGHATTNDGATILGAMKFADPLEEIGRKILYEAVSRANRASGDGSSTATVLTASILEEGMKHLGEVAPMELKRSLEACIPIIEEAIKAQKKEITIDSVAAVASISAEDEQIGKTIQDIYSKIGKDGIISWDISKTAEDSYTIGSGLTINGATVVAPYMLEDTKETRLKNPKILLARKKITTALDFEKLFPMLFSQEIKEIVVFCDDIEVQVVADLFKTQRIRGFKTIVIKMPVLWKDEWWEDLSLATGAKLIDALSGIKVADATLEHLGTVEHLTVNKEDTFIDGIQNLNTHIFNLQAQGDDKSLLRASRLNTRTARYFVGAHSEQALFYRRLKVEDAINAASCALEGGIVPGGGVALLNVALSLNPAETIGKKILHKALQSPISQIIMNAGIKADGIGRSVFSNEGFDTRTGKLVDMFEANIVDPALVVINAIKSAIGVAATILTAGSVITLPKEEKPK